MSTRGRTASVTWGEGDGPTTGSTYLLYRQYAIDGGDTVSDTTDPTKLYSSQFSIPANQFVLGSIVQIRACGVWNTDVLAVNLQTDVYLGGNLVATTGALSQPANVTNRNWEISIDLTCQAVGAAGTLEIQGYRHASISAIARRFEELPAISSTQNTTSDMPFYIELTWGAASADNKVQLRQFHALYMEVPGV